MKYQKIVLKKILYDKDLYLFNRCNKSLFLKSGKTTYIFIENFYNKFGNLPEIDEFKAFISNYLSEDIAEIIGAFIDGLSFLKTTLSSDKLYEELKKEYIITKLSDKANTLIESLKDKKTDEAISIINDIENDVLTIDSKYNPTDIRELDFSEKGLYFSEMFLESMHEDNVYATGVTLIQARENAGKSIFALNQALYSYKKGLNVAFYSMEMPLSQLQLRMYSCENNIPYNEINNDKDKINKVNAWLKDFFNKDNKFLIDTVRYNDIALLKTIKQQIKQGVKIFVIDYLNLVEFTNTNIADYKAMSDLVKQLHDLSLEYGVVFISPVQVHIEETKTSVRAVSRTSREIDFTASLSILLYQNDEERKENAIRIIINKNRTGIKPIYVCSTDFKNMKFIDTGVRLS